MTGGNLIRVQCRGFCQSILIWHEPKYSGTRLLIGRLTQLDTPSRAFHLRHIPLTQRILELSHKQTPLGLKALSVFRRSIEITLLPGWQSVVGPIPGFPLSEGASYTPARCPGIIVPQSRI